MEESSGGQKRRKSIDPNEELKLTTTNLAVKNDVIELYQQCFRGVVVENDLVEWLASLQVGDLIELLCSEFLELVPMSDQSRAALIGLITNTIVDKKVKDFGLVLAQMTPIKTLLFFDAFYAYLQLRKSNVNPDALVQAILKRASASLVIALMALSLAWFDQQYLDHFNLCLAVLRPNTSLPSIRMHLLIQGVYNNLTTLDCAGQIDMDVFLTGQKAKLGPGLLDNSFWRPLDRLEIISFVMDLSRNCGALRPTSLFRMFLRGRDFLPLLLRHYVEHENSDFEDMLTNMILDTDEYQLTDKTPSPVPMCAVDYCVQTLDHIVGSTNKRLEDESSFKRAQTSANFLHKLSKVKLFRQKLTDTSFNRLMRKHENNVAFLQSIASADSMPTAQRVASPLGHIHKHLVDDIQVHFLSLGNKSLLDATAPFLPPSRINNFIERVKCLYGVSEDSDPLGPASIAFGLPVHECEGLARYCVELFNKKGYLSEFPIKHPTLVSMLLKAITNSLDVVPKQATGIDSVAVFKESNIVSLLCSSADGFILVCGGRPGTQITSLPTLNPTEFADFWCFITHAAGREKTKKCLSAILACCGAPIPHRRCSMSGIVNVLTVASAVTQQLSKSTHAVDDHLIHALSCTMDLMQFVSQSQFAPTLFRWKFVRYSNSCSVLTRDLTLSRLQSNPSRPQSHPSISTAFQILNSTVPAALMSLFLRSCSSPNFRCPCPDLSRPCAQSMMLAIGYLDQLVSNQSDTTLIVAVFDSWTKLLHPWASRVRQDNIDHKGLFAEVIDALLLNIAQAMESSRSASILSRLPAYLQRVGGVPLPELFKWTSGDAESSIRMLDTMSNVRLFLRFNEHDDSYVAVPPQLIETCSASNLSILTRLLECISELITMLSKAIPLTAAPSLSRFVTLCMKTLAGSDNEDVISACVKIFAALSTYKPALLMWLKMGPPTPVEVLLGNIRNPLYSRDDDRRRLNSMVALLKLAQCAFPDPEAHNLLVSQFQQQNVINLVCEHALRPPKASTAQKDKPDDQRLVQMARALIQFIQRLCAEEKQLFLGPTIDNIHVLVDRISQRGETLITKLAADDSLKRFLIILFTCITSATDKIMKDARAIRPIVQLVVSLWAIPQTKDLVITLSRLLEVLIHPTSPLLAYLKQRGGQAVFAATLGKWHQLELDTATLARLAKFQNFLA